MPYVFSIYFEICDIFPNDLFELYTSIKRFYSLFQAAEKDNSEPRVKKLKTNKQSQDILPVNCRSRSMQAKDKSSFEEISFVNALLDATAVVSGKGVDVSSFVRPYVMSFQF